MVERNASEALIKLVTENKENELQQFDQNIQFVPTTMRKFVNGKFVYLKGVYRVVTNSKVFKELIDFLTCYSSGIVDNIQPIMGGDMNNSNWTCDAMFLYAKQLFKQKAVFILNPSIQGKTEGDLDQLIKSILPITAIPLEKVVRGNSYTVWGEDKYLNLIKEYFGKNKGVDYTPVEKQSPPISFDKLRDNCHEILKPFYNKENGEANGRQEEVIDRGTPKDVGLQKVNSSKDKETGSGKNPKKLKQAAQIKKSVVNTAKLAGSLMRKEETGSKFQSLVDTRKDSEEDEDSMSDSTQSWESVGPSNKTSKRRLESDSPITVSAGCSGAVVGLSQDVKLGKGKTPTKRKKKEKGFDTDDPSHDDLDKTYDFEMERRMLPASDSPPKNAETLRGGQRNSTQNNLQSREELGSSNLDSSF